MTWSIFEQIPVPLTDDLKQQINDFYELLNVENQKYNLTRITDRKEMLNKHFLDSLLFTKKFPLTNQKILDMGTGAGFPGLVLKLFYPNLNLTLVESNQKKTKFLEMVIKKLDLKNVKVVTARAEDYARAHRNQFDVVISRAVANLRILLELGAPLLKPKGFLIALKGPKVNEEQQLVGDLANKLGLNFSYNQKVMDYDYGERINLFYQKQGLTPEIYPRPYRIIKKEMDNLRKK